MGESLRVQDYEVGFERKRFRPDSLSDRMMFYQIRGDRRSKLVFIFARFD
ncbi:MAG TPA: hypothetical protein V6D14_22645 [Coleofasciculaceae cyanobacterium]